MTGRSTRRALSLCLPLLVLLAGVFLWVDAAAAPVAPSSETDPLSRRRAIFVYQFTNYIAWPLTDEPAGPFRIGVIGDSPVAGVLEQIATKRQVSGRVISVHRWRSVEELGSCHILYVAPDHDSSLAAILAALRGNSTLVVTERPGFASRGAGISFFLEDTKMRFELNRKSVERAGLRISSQLLKLARIVDEE